MSKDANKADKLQGEEDEDIRNRSFLYKKFNRDGTAIKHRPRRRENGEGGGTATSPLEHRRDRLPSDENSEDDSSVFDSENEGYSSNTTESTYSDSEYGGGESRSKDFARPDNQVATFSFSMVTAYMILGSLFSFTAGRAPGTPPEMVEMALPAVATGFFVLMYSAVDQLSVGVSNREKLQHEKSERYIRADGAHRSQLQQMPSFFASLWAFSFIVNGRLGGWLGLLWAVLRVMYSNYYRASASNTNLTRFSTPASMILNTLAAGTLVHGLRILFS